MTYHLVIETRIWGDSDLRDFNHKLTLTLRRAMISGIIQLIFKRTCDQVALLTRKRLTDEDYTSI